jgi:hypothetical protein
MRITPERDLLEVQRILSDGPAKSPDLLERFTRKMADLAEAPKHPIGEGSFKEGRIRFGDGPVFTLPRRPQIVAILL